MSSPLDVFREDIFRALDDIKDNQRTEFAEVKAKQDFTNGKVRKLEIWRARATGVITGIGVVAGAPSLILTVLTIMDKI